MLLQILSVEAKPSCFAAVELKKDESNKKLKVRQGWFMQRYFFQINLLFLSWADIYCAIVTVPIFGNAAQ